MNTFKDIDSYVSALNDTINGIPKHLTDMVDRHADSLIANTKSRTPVDTGRLKASWQRTPTAKDGNRYSTTISNAAVSPRGGAEYASFVEYGHYSLWGNWVEGRFMFTTSQESEREDLNRDLDGSQKQLYSHIS